MKNNLTFNQWIAVAVSLVAVGAIIFSSFRLSPEFKAPDFLDNTQNSFMTEENMGNKNGEQGLPDKSFLEGIEDNGTLQTQDLTLGIGEEAISGKIVVVNYEGFLAADGTKFDSSWDRGEPFSFTLGAGSVIEGWEKGLLGMKEGGVRTIVIPSQMGYGERDYGPIPGNSTLVFVVELIEVQ